MKWYFTYPNTEKKVYLSFEEKHAELAWDFVNARKLRLTSCTPKGLDEKVIETFMKLYDLDREESLKVINWTYYFYLNNDVSTVDYYIPIEGETEE